MSREYDDTSFIDDHEKRFRYRGNYTLFIIIFSLFIFIPMVYFMSSVDMSFLMVSGEDNVTYLDEPFQAELDSNLFFEKNEVVLEPLYIYKIQARVIAKKRYTHDIPSVISPYDFALGWENMSDPDIISKLAVSQSGRFYYWSTQDSPIPLDDIVRTSANVHIIPKDDSVEKVLDEVRTGDIVTLEGYLVDVRSQNLNFIWETSTVRHDSGPGGCEIMYVEKVRIG